VPVGWNTIFDISKCRNILNYYWRDKPNYLITFPTQVLYSAQNIRVCALWKYSRIFTTR